MQTISMFGILLLLAIGCSSSNVYPSMSCVSDSSYRNNLDEPMSDVAKSGHFLSGSYSYHDNKKEDRRWRYDWCQPTGDSAAYTSPYNLGYTSYDATFTQMCASNAAMVGVTYSVHSNKKEDRMWIFKCGYLDSDKYSLTSCGWTEQLNSWDGVLNYQCSSDGVIQGIWSEHSNYKEDRIWKYYCCRLKKEFTATAYWVQQKATEVTLTSNQDSDFRNELESSFYDASQDNSYLCGVSSSRSSSDVDRRYKFTFCSSSASANAYDTEVTLRPTPMNATVIRWQRSCEGQNDKNAVMIGIESSIFDSDQMRRKWIFKCGLLDTTKYVLDSCAWTDYVNGNGDDLAELEHICDDGVMRAIYSGEDSVGDVRFQFECCQLNYIGIQQYEINIGVDSTDDDTVITDSIVAELKDTITHGFEFENKENAETEIYTDDNAETTVADIEESGAFSTDLSSETVYCDAEYLHQFKVTVDTLEVHSSTLCSDDTYVLCPLGFTCDDAAAHYIVNGNNKDNMFSDYDGTFVVNQNVAYYILIAMVVFIGIYIAFLLHRLRVADNIQYKPVSDTDV